MRLRRTLLAPVATALTLLAIGNAHGAAVIHLPYPAGVTVSVLQGYNGGTHTGVERYSLDLTRDDGKTSNSPALAPAAGTVVWAYPPGTNTGCIGIEVDGGGGLNEMLCHVILNHTYQNGDHVSSGQNLGLVGPPGTVGNNGTSHIHLQLYRVVAGERTPVPFALPDGAPLESVSLPAASSYDQWACTGSGPSCHMMSFNGPGSPAPVTGPPSGNIASAGSAAGPGATVSSPRQAVALGIGIPVAVTGTGDCLNIHAQPSMSARVVYCVPDGTQAVLTDGPQVADGFTWFKLDSLGWAVADYLVATGPGSIAPAPSAAPTAPAAAPTPQPTPAPAAPSSAAPAGAPSSASPELPNGVSFGTGDTVVVTGTGDCLRVHDQPSVSGEVLDCLADGTVATIADGPQQGDGLTWWDLDGHGWVDGEYLTAR